MIAVGAGRWIQSAPRKNGVNLFKAFVFRFGHLEKQEDPEDGDQNDEGDENQALELSRQVSDPRGGKGRMKVRSVAEVGNEKVKKNQRMKARK